MTTDRDPIDNADQPPEVDIHGPRSQQLPPAPSAAERILEFVSWFGDGEVMGPEDGNGPPLYARDLESAAKAALSPPKIVIDFINQRSGYVQACRATRSTDSDADYHRWQGHLESRRQLAQALGYTVPYEPGEKTEKVPTTEAVPTGAASVVQEDL